jgi:hypothetical protein
MKADSTMNLKGAEVARIARSAGIEGFQALPAIPSQGLPEIPCRAR